MLPSIRVRLEYLQWLKDDSEKGFHIHMDRHTHTHVYTYYNYKLLLLHIHLIERVITNIQQARDAEKLKL